MGDSRLLDHVYSDRFKYVHRILTHFSVNKYLMLVPGVINVSQPADSFRRAPPAPFEIMQQSCRKNSSSNLMLKD